MEASSRAERIRGSSIPADGDSRRMEREAQEEALGCLRRMASLKLTPTSLDPLEPVREAPPQRNINTKKICGPPRTSSKPKGSSRVILWENGKPIVFGTQYVRLKQAIPAGDKLRQQQEELHSQTGGTTNPEDPCPEHQVVFCIPLCHL